MLFAHESRNHFGDGEPNTSTCVKVPVYLRFVDKDFFEGTKEGEVWRSRPGPEIVKTLAICQPGQIVDSSSQRDRWAIVFQRSHSGGGIDYYHTLGCPDVGS